MPDLTVADLMDSIQETIGVDSYLKIRSLLLRLADSTGEKTGKEGSSRFWTLQQVATQDDEHGALARGLQEIIDSLKHLSPPRVTSRGEGHSEPWTVLQRPTSSTGACWEVHAGHEIVAVCFTVEDAKNIAAEHNEFVTGHPNWGLICTCTHKFEKHAVLGAHCTLCNCQKFVDRASLNFEDFDFALGQLRHLYKQMQQGIALDSRGAAQGLLGPAIEKLEYVRAALGGNGG